METWLSGRVLWVQVSRSQQVHRPDLRPTQIQILVQQVSYLPRELAESDPYAESVHLSAKWATQTCRTASSEGTSGR